MKIKELRELSKEELKNKLVDFQKQFMELQLKKKTGVEKPHLFNQTKKDIARILTLLKEKGDSDG
ncbi:MAG: 50S ribosomal protein L29 [Candidatus Omnitrophota bacterium]|nr:MAG: 50S ribosomal protein L29 [Candidatus Omnitrophota bacterium]